MYLFFFNGRIIQQCLVRAGLNTGGIKSGIKPFNAKVTFECMFILACQVGVGSAVRAAYDTPPAPYTAFFIKVDYPIIQTLYSAADACVHAPWMLASAALYNVWI